MRADVDEAWWWHMESSRDCRPCACEHVWYFFMILYALQCIESLILARTCGMPPTDTFSWVHNAVLKIEVCFCIRYFLALLSKQVASFCDLWLLNYDLFSTTCHDLVNENVPCCESFHLLFYIHDKSRYPWRLKCNSAMHQASLSAGDPVQVLRRHHIWHHRRSRKRLRQ